MKFRRIYSILELVSNGANKWMPPSLPNDCVNNTRVNNIVHCPCVSQMSSIYGMSSLHWHCHGNHCDIFSFDDTEWRRRKRQQRPVATWNIACTTFPQYSSMSSVTLNRRLRQKIHFSIEILGFDCPKCANSTFYSRIFTHFNPQMHGE